MEYLFISGMFGAVLLILQLHFSGQLAEKNRTIESQREFLESRFDEEEALHKRILYLEERLKYANSELTRLERLNNG
jgi:hypothetical protein